MTETESTSERLNKTQLEQRIKQLEYDNCILTRVIGAQKQTDEYFKRYGYDEQQVSRLFNGCSERNDVWIAVNLALERHIHAETDAVCGSTFDTNENMRSNVSRLSSLTDFRASLLKLHAAGNVGTKDA